MPAHDQAACPTPTLLKGAVQVESDEDVDIILPSDTPLLTGNVGRDFDLERADVVPRSKFLIPHAACSGTQLDLHDVPI